MGVLIGIICGLAVVMSFVLGTLYGKSIEININHTPKFDGEYLQQPRIENVEVERYYEQTGGLNL